MGKGYEVPSDLTIMKAMEYVGYRPVRGAGCRGGFCGACATIYRLKDDYRLHMALACQKTVEDGMYLTQIPFTPVRKTVYDLDELDSSGTLLLEYYPEIARCVSCNTCTKACPQDLDVMDYVQAAIRGDIEQVTALSFDCIRCGLCAVRCPAEIAPYQVALLARRLYGKYVLGKEKQLDKRLRELEEEKLGEDVVQLIEMDVGELRASYERREIEE
ncbi:MAG: 4Fe-4S dicluster domain-containing protein [Candidatus Bathyarchaeota archaeon]|nr:MAG: 4Fe-4S dicluster domain-containing protein [Candidatus Bathyarchaeota archaeon]